MRDQQALAKKYLVKENLAQVVIRRLKSRRTGRAGQGEWGDLTEVASYLLIVEKEMTAQGRAIRALVWA